MANKQLFGSATKNGPPADTVNEAGGLAYNLSAEAALAQYVCTGTFNNTFYATGDEQLLTVLGLAKTCSPEFIGKLAVYARGSAYMKDTPALLCAVLTTNEEGRKVLTKIFDRVIDNGKMLRNFVQIMRSGVVGRKSLGSMPRRMVRNWLAKRDGDQLFRDSVGNEPSLADVIKMVHPRPTDEERSVLYQYLIGKEVEDLTVLGRASLLAFHYESYKSSSAKYAIPNVPFQMLAGLGDRIGKAEWTEIARNAAWTMTRMNLNTFARHGVFDDKAMIDMVAKRLRDPELIRKARAFPYQLLVAYLNANEEVPFLIREALQDAMEIAIENVPALEGQKVWVFPDVSGSMSSPATGNRVGSTTKVRCVHVAGLVASAILRKNPTAGVIPFEGHCVNVRLNPRDSVMTNAQLLASLGGGSTNCSAPLAVLNRDNAKADLIIYVSDNESWVDTNQASVTEAFYGIRAGTLATATMTEWKKFKRRNPKAKMVCIDIQPYRTAQASDDKDILNVGGFSDVVFKLLGDFARGGEGHWTDEIEKVEL